MKNEQLTHKHTRTHTHTQHIVLLKQERLHQWW